jgi:hypothetical protein
MAEEPTDLIRLEGEGNSLVLRITGRDGGDGLVGEFQVDTPFVRGSLKTWIGPEDLRQWQQALDKLDVGENIGWRAFTRAPWLFIDLDEGRDRCQVTIEDSSMSLTKVTLTVPLTDEWFDDAYHRLALTWETWLLREGTDATATNPR